MMGRGQHNDKRSVKVRTMAAQKAYYEWRLQESAAETNRWHQEAIRLMALLIEWGSGRQEGQG